MTFMVSVVLLAGPEELGLYSQFTKNSGPLPAPLPEK
jgi:hypothetical protein